MRQRIALVIVLLALAGQPAIASQTACVFEGGEAPQYYELELIGYSDKDPMIVFSSTVFGSGKRITLHSANYTLKHFSQKAKSVSLEFRNPEDLALPPSFSLTGTGGEALLTTGSSTVQGVLACDF